MDFVEKAKLIAQEQIYEVAGESVHIDDITIVEYTETLQNKRILLSTIGSYQPLIEVIENGDRYEFFVTCYLQVKTFAMKANECTKGG